MSEDAATPLEKAPNYQAQLEAEPWRFDFYAAMRRLERSFLLVRNGGPRARQ